MTAHAELRPPSSASRWLSCPGSVEVLQTYDNMPSEASIRGDIAHKLLEESLEWGTVPDHPDVDIMYGVMMAMEYINKMEGLHKSRGTIYNIYAEQQLDIPETGEFGTADVIFVTEDEIEIIDYKNGYVPVTIFMNAQLMCYLLGAIAKYGPRKRYQLTVIQPNYVHIDGMIRSFSPDAEQLEWFREQVFLSLASQEILAGKHCKNTYCPARGTCEVFLAWSQENLKLAWYPGETVAMTDEALAEAMEQADILQGYRDQLRGEAMRRMLQQNKTISGYKLVKGKKDRAYANDEARQKVLNNLCELGASPDDLYERKPISPAGVERIGRQAAVQVTGPGALGSRAWISSCRLNCWNPANQSLTVEKVRDRWEEAVQARQRI